MWQPCSDIPVGEVQVLVLSHGKETKLGPQEGQDDGRFTSGSVLLGFDCCTVTSFPFQGVSAITKVMILRSSSKTNSFSQMSLCNCLIIV